MSREIRDLTVVADDMRHRVRDQRCNGSVSDTYCGREYRMPPRERDHGENVRLCPACYPGGS